jgi:hypothetical protein
MAIFVLVVLCILDLFFVLRKIIQISEDEVNALLSLIMVLIITLAIVFQSINL